MIIINERYNFMRNKKHTISDYIQSSSKKISTCIELTEIIDELIDGDRKIFSLVSIINKNLKSVSYNLEKTKNMV